MTWLKEKGPIYAPVALRLGLCGVVLWFSINQLLNPEQFIGYLPPFLLNSDYAQIAVLANGAFELVFGGLLLAGFFTRTVAFVLTLHLLSIAITLGYNDIMIRDLGLAFAMSSIVIGGADTWCLDKRKR